MHTDDFPPHEADETGKMPQDDMVPEDLASWQRQRIDLSRIHKGVQNIRHEISRVVAGQYEAIDMMLASIFAGGHILIEGVPGIAKTLLAKLLARTMDTGFSRIQFTPDLMPSDVLGTTVFNVKTSEFTFNQGPIFSNVVLIDEINRAPAKTQSALFEVMEEYQVTLDGQTYPMEYPFFVIATQNPIEQEGTYKLPEAQLDRFLVRILLDYPSLEDEKTILRRFQSDFSGQFAQTVNSVLSPEDIRICRDLVEQIHIREELLDYIATIVHRTRNHGDLFLGASPRASLAIMKMAKAFAAMEGRDFVTPDDIKHVVFPVLNHRIILTSEREMEGFTTLSVVEEILAGIEVPR
jgi:MoxR-like ATPase